jgi:hypothetical protein
MHLEKDHLIGVGGFVCLRLHVLPHALRGHDVDHACAVAVVVVERSDREQLRAVHEAKAVGEGDRCFLSARESINSM